MRSRRAFLTAALATLVLAIPGSAAANDLYTLDANAQSEGNVIVDAAGNAYVGWTSEGVGIGIEPVKFCKIAQGGACSPINLPIPGGTSISESASAAFPVFGPGNTVYVVSPRYAKNDVVFWTSTNGGASFDAGQQRDPYSGKTDPTDAYLVGDEFLIGGYNAGLGFSTAKVSAPGGGEFEFENPGDGGIGASSMALAGSNPVIAYWNISDPPYPLMFYRHVGGPFAVKTNWAGPTEVTKGYEPRLSGGPAGLFMVSQDYVPGGRYPQAVNVRLFEGTNFGAARTLAVDADTDLFVGGAIAQSQSGTRLAVAWPGTRSADKASVMRLWTSTDGGNSFVESHVAHLGSFGIGNNADMATNDAGVGWIVFRDDKGLRLADFSPIAAAPATPPTSIPVKAKAPPIYKGKTKTVVSKVGDFLIVLRLPKSCLQSRQRFFVGVGKRKRRQLNKKLGGEVRFTKIVFIYDGKKLKVKKKKPFRYLIDPGVISPGSVHVVKARVTAILEKGNKERKIKRVIKGTVKGC
jgi:hypothetical protein